MMDCNKEQVTHNLRSEISAIFNALEVLETQGELTEHSLEIVKLILEKRQNVEQNLTLVIQELKKDRL